jgi:hypothetical protein
MTYKSQIVTDLGVYELLIPRLINEALLANDRVKYFFSYAKSGILGAILMGLGRAIAPLPWLPPFVCPVLE